MLFRLIYASRPAADAIQDLDKVLARIQPAAIAHNRAHSVTSRIAADAGWIVQVLEGPEPAVRGLYGQIEGDRRHGETQVVVAEEAVSRKFGRWGLAVRVLSKRDVATLQALGRGAVDNPAAAGPRVVMRLLTVIAEAHGDKFDRQQRVAAA